MAYNSSSNREQEIQDIWQSNKTFFRLGFIAVVLLVGIVIGALIFNDNVNFSLNMYGEIISIIVTALVVDQIIRRRDRKQMQQRLLRDVAGPSEDVAKAAINIMREEDWLTGDRSLLKKAYLWEAKLAGVALNGANLAGAALGNSYFMEAYLSNVDFSGADLMGANLAKADMVNTNFHNAQMRYANLEGAYLGAANLRGANLQDAYLADAHLTDMYFGDATFDENTVLPDGSRWDTSAELDRFTDPAHPNFWQPGWVAEKEMNP